MIVENHIKQLNTQTNPKLKGFTRKQYNNQPKATTNPNFTGFGGVAEFGNLALRFLDTNQAWGACAVDLGCMVLPRTITDFSRGTDAGMETARREGMGTANHSMVGVYGTLAGLALAAGINGIYKFGNNDVKANEIFADSETLDLHSKIFNEKLKAASQGDSKANPIREYLTETFKRYETLSPTENSKWIKLDDEAIAKTVDIMEKEINGTSKKISKEGLNNARNTIISALGSENNFRIIAEQGEKNHTSRYTVDYILENVYKLGKVFSKDTVQDAFKNSTDIASNAFLKAMKSMNIKRSLIGIGIASAIGVSAQPLNIYLTKKKTGKSGFVGGGKEDNSTKFKIKKGLAALLFGSGVLATIGNPKNLVKDLQFKGFTPSIKQFKFIYGVTIMSRFLAARNDNELSESAIKDTLGFANWLILGNFVQKLVAQAFDKSLIKKDGEGIMKWITNSVLKTRDEVLHASLGKKAFKDGKALNFNEMLKLADKATKKKIRALNIAQIVGYAYSGLVLGCGIPRLNIYLTNRREAKNNAKNLTPEATPTSTNIAFMKAQQKHFI